MMDEIWKSINGYEGMYEVSNFGNVASLNYRNTGRKQNLSQGIAKIGYPVVVLCKDAIQVMHYVHRLVADAFIPNPSGKKEVNHIDGCKTNNRVENLEWATRQENQSHACKIGLCDIEKAWKASVEKSRIPIVQMDMGGDVLCTFSSLSKAQRATHIGHSIIAECARGQRENAGGYKWRFLDESK